MSFTKDTRIKRTAKEDAPAAVDARAPVQDAVHLSIMKTENSRQ